MFVEDNEEKCRRICENAEDSRRERRYWSDPGQTVSGSVGPIVRTNGPDCREPSGLQGGTFSPSRTFSGLGSGKVLLTTVQTPHILDTNCLDSDLEVALQRKPPHPPKLSLW